MQYDSDVLDLSVREVLTLAGAEHLCEDTALEIAQNVGFEGPPKMLIAEIIKESDLHPVNAGTLFTEVVRGLDVGRNAQGGYHPDFQPVLERLQRDPDKIYNDETWPTELEEQYRNLIDN